MMRDARMAQGLRRLTFAALAAFIVSCQALLGLWGVDDDFTRGHNGYNSSAYLLSARNALRFERLFPHQYHTDPEPPALSEAYTHAPLATHLSNIVAVSVLGDRPLAVRAVSVVNGCLMVAALLWVVSAHFTPAHGLLAAAVYVALPINAIFVNMSNHSVGFQLWSLLMLHSYLRFRARESRGWFVALLVTAFIATSWDWPAYYVAFVLALDWLARFWGARRRSETDQTFAKFAPWFLGYCFTVLLALAAFVLTMLLFAAGPEDLLKTFAARQVVAATDYRRTLAIVPRMMFSLPVLLACAFYLLDFFVRALCRRSQAREVIPLAFAFAGVLHAALFKESAVVHEYWLWPALPFAAIATADVCLRGAFWLRARLPVLHPALPRTALSALSFVLVSLLPLSLLAHSLTVVPKGRRVGGSMWFVSNVRQDFPEAYNSGLSELRFAELVRASTDRASGVLLHDSMKRFDLEPRFDATLDRALRPVAHLLDEAPSVAGVDGWVLIGSLSTIDSEQVIMAAGDYAVTFFDHYFMIDRRLGDRTVRVIRLALPTRRLAHRLLRSADVVEVRDRALEAELMRQRMGLPF
jgi:hypothetical protein